MNATYTLLAHFSQRYPKIPVFTDAHNQVGVNFDMMRVKIRDLPILPKYVKALQTLYKDTDRDEVEDLSLEGGRPKINSIWIRELSHLYNFSFHHFRKYPNDKLTLLIFYRVHFIISMNLSPR
jgi:hypothetical protein